MALFPAPLYYRYHRNNAPFQEVEFWLALDECIATNAYVLGNTYWTEY